MKVRAALLFIITYLLPVYCLFAQGDAGSVAVYEGKVGTAEIHMELSNLNGQLIGWYNYPGKSTKLRVEGTIDPDGSFVLKEYDYRAQPTGNFVGEVQEDQTMLGKWNNPTDSKVLPILLNYISGKKILILQKVEAKKAEREMRDTPVQTASIQQERKMFQPSKVKGYSKLALWTTIGLIVAFIITVVFLLKNKKKALEAQKNMFEHTRDVHYSDKHVLNSQMSDKHAARKGYEFEKFVVDLFPDNYYKLRFWASDKVSNKQKSASSNQSPDLLIEYTNKSWSRSFAVECKYRSNISEEGFIIDQRQFENYKSFEIQNDVKVFVALGIGGDPTLPSQFFLFPIHVMQTNCMDISRLKLFQQFISRDTSEKVSQMYYNYREESLKIWNQKQ